MYRKPSQLVCVGGGGEGRVVRGVKGFNNSGQS